MLRTEHDVRQVVSETFGIEGEERNDEFWFLCPNPEHEEQHASCSVNLKTGLWHCFSCGASGNLITLGELVLRRSRKDVHDLLEPSNPDAQLARLQNRLDALRALREETRDPAPYVPVPTLDAYADRPMNYMYDRGLQDEVLNRYCVKFCRHDTIPTKKGEANITNSVAIPIQIDEEQPLAWCYRATDLSENWQPRYLYTLGVSLVEHWYGWYQSTPDEDVVVVEGPIDALWVAQQGFNVLAMMGTSHLNERKLAKLSRFKSLTIFADRDNAGAVATQKLGEALFDRMPVRVAVYGSWSHGAKDPQELAGVDVELAIERAVPWLTWRQKLARR